MTTFTPSDIADIWENPNFGELSFEERGDVLNNIIAGASEYARSAPDYDAEVQRTMNQLIDAGRAKLAESETWGEKGKWAGGVAGQTVVDSAKVIVATAADAGFVQDNNQTGELEGKVPLGNVGSGLWTGAQGIWEAAGHGVAAITHREESKALETEIENLKAEIDDVKYPLQSTEALKGWLRERDSTLESKRRAWIKAADTQADDAAIDAQVKKRRITSDPEILQNLVSYMRTRTPGTWDAVRRGLIETATTAALNVERDSVKETPVGRFLDNTGIGADMLVAAGDPLDNALIGLIPVGKGASAVRKGWKAAAKGVAVGIASETASEVGSLLMENPDATLGEVKDTAKAGAIGAGGLTAAGAAGGKAVDMWKGQPSPVAPGQTAEAGQPSAMPSTVEGVAIEGPTDLAFADQLYRYENGVWMKPYIPGSLSELDASPNLPPAMVPLNPADPVEGALIVHLDAQRKAASRKKPAGSAPESFVPPVQEPKSTSQPQWQDAVSVASGADAVRLVDETDPTRFVIVARDPEEEGWRATIFREDNPVGHETFSSRENAVAWVFGDDLTSNGKWVVSETKNVAKKNDGQSRQVEPAPVVDTAGPRRVDVSKPAASPSLPDPTGTDSDLISALKRTGTLGVTDSPEWDWYRRLEEDAKASKLKPQTAEAMARRGELDGDAKVTLAWLNQNGIVSTTGGKRIDEAVEELTGAKNSEGATSFQAFDVDAANLGDSILAAIDARVKAREQGSYDGQMAEQERMVVAAERELTNRFIAHAMGSPGVPMSGNALSNAAVVGSKVDIGGKTFEVVDVNPTAGTVDVTGEFGWQRILPDDEVNVSSIDGESLSPMDDVADIPDDNIAFARTDATDEKAKRSLPAASTNRRSFLAGLVASFIPAGIKAETDSRFAIPQKTLDILRTMSGQSPSKAAVDLAQWADDSTLTQERADLVSEDAKEAAAAGLAPDQNIDKAFAEVAKEMAMVRKKQREIIAAVQQLMGMMRPLFGEVEGAITIAPASNSISMRLSGDVAGRQWDGAQTTLDGRIEVSPRTLLDLIQPNSKAHYRAVATIANELVHRFQDQGKLTDLRDYLPAGPREVYEKWMGNAYSSTSMPYSERESFYGEWMVGKAVLMKRGEPLNAPLPPELRNDIELSETVDRDIVRYARVDKAEDAGQPTDHEPADSVFQSLESEPISDSQLTAKELDGLEAVRRAEKNPYISAARVNPKGSRSKGTSAARFLEALRQVFGKDVLFVHPGKGNKPLSFEGGTVNGSRNTLLVDATSKHPLLWISGHELVHALKAQRPDLWEKLRDGLLALASDWSAYKEKLSKLDYKDTEHVDEFLGDFVGAMFREPEFWKKMEAKNPSLFSTIARAALDLLDRILKAVAKLKRDVRGYFKDLEAAREVVADILNEYAADGFFPEKVLADSSDADLVRASVEGSPMRLVSARIAEASDSLRAMLKEHKATRDERTVDGEPIEQAGYLVRRDADMEAMADEWLDGFAEQQAREGKSMEETRAALSDLLDREDVDIAAVLLTRLIDERGREFGFDPKEVEALGQKNASRAGFALREWKKTLDPLDKLVDQANTNTGTAMGKAFGVDAGKGGNPSDVPAQMNAELQQEMKVEADKAALDAIGNLRSKNSELRRELDAARERIAEEKARADQQLEVGVAIGREEGLAEGLAQQPEAPARELDRFELWLMGESYAEGLQGLPSLEKVAQRFIQPQRWNAEGFRAAVSQLFPALDTNILDDAIERIDQQMRNRMDAARRRAIDAFLERLTGRRDALQKDQRFVTFYKHLQNAARLGILDSQVFADAFAAAWGLNGLTAAAVQTLRQMYQAIVATNAQGQPVHFGMVRETMERRLVEAINRIAPAQALGNLIFNNYQARVLSSASSMLNQFSGIFRMIAPVDAVARSYRIGTAATVIPEWWKGVSSLVKNLPLMLTAIRGESLGHLPSHVAAGHVPTSQQTQNLGAGERVRVMIGGRQVTLGARLSWLARMAELWTWRTIRAAEGLTGIADAEAHFREVLSRHYVDQGMRPGEAYKQALQDIHADPAAVQAARQQATQEQGTGDIGVGAAALKRRTAEIIQRQIDTRLAAANTDRSEQLTAYAQFKTMPAGPIGFAVSKFMAMLSSPQGNLSKYARFWFMFGRFLGHTVDLTLGYTPGAHLLNKANFDTNNTQRQRLITEVFGSEEAYRRMVDSRAAAGFSFLLMMGVPAILSALAAGDDEDPFFSVTGTGGLGDPSRREALQATGRWGEMQIRVGDFKMSYSQIPELAPLLGIIGNVSDHIRFGKFLNQREAGDREKKGKYPARWHSLGIGFAAEWALTPIKRSTYRAWFDMIDSGLGINSAGSADYFGEQVVKKATQPIDGMLRVPIAVDVDKYLDKQAGSKKPDSLAEAILRRVPFTDVGEKVFNAYGEQTPAWDIFSIFPTDPQFSEEVTRAARLNVQTGTRRSAPSSISMEYDDGTKRVLKAAELSAYQELSGKIFTESLLRNEDDIRRAFNEGGQGAAEKIVRNISLKANKEAKKQLELR